MSLKFASTYPCLPVAAGRARTWSTARIRSAIPAHPGAALVIDEAVLVINELLTNAIRAGSHTARLSLSIDAERLRIGVTDDAAELPRLLPSGSTSTCGRGLRIVEALSSSWGVLPAGSGKEVWAELALPRA